MQAIRGSVWSPPCRNDDTACRDRWRAPPEPQGTGGSKKDLKPPRTPSGEDDRATKPHLFFERHDSICDLQFRITDLANAIDHPLEGFGESPGGKRPACLVEVIDVGGCDGWRRGALRIRKGNLGEDQCAALGLKTSVTLRPKSEFFQVSTTSSPSRRRAEKIFFPVPASASSTRVGPDRVHPDRIQRAGKKTRSRAGRLVLARI